MEDVRVSIRLTSEQHKALKIIAIKKDSSIQELLLDYVVRLIQEENKNEEN